MNLPKPSTNLPELALWVMDATHAKAAQLLDNIKNATDEELPVMVEFFVQHTKEHFEQERKMMLETDFPAYSEHESEHGRIMADIVQFQSSLKRGNIKFARLFFTKSLPESLENHVRQVDSALAAHIKKVTDSGKKARSA